MFANLLKSGWVHAFIMGLLIYPAGTITQKFVAVNNDINIIAYTCLCMLSSSLILLIMAGPGKLTKESLKLPHTWIYGLLEMFTLSVGVAIMIYISATEAAALARTTAIFSFLLSIIFLSQPTNKFELAGFAILVVGFLYSIDLIHLPTEIKISLVTLIIVKNFLQASKKVTAELHKTNRKANNFRDELRVTGIVMAVSSLLVSLMLATLAYIQDLYGIKIHDQIPTFADFINFKLFLVAVFGGIVLLSVLKYLEFYVSKTLGAKYLMSMASLQIIGIYFMEKALSLVGLVEMKEFSTENFIALAIIFIGNIIIAMAGFIKNINFIKKGRIQNTLSNLDEYFVDNENDFKVCKSNLNCILTNNNNNYKLTSKQLEIDIDKLILFNAKDFADFKLDLKSAQKINNYASINISLKDQLTQVYNRYHLENKVKELFLKNINFDLYYLDLNKFKPINDKYGHTIGDKVLLEFVKRINKVIEPTDTLVRLGGDEFVVVRINTNKDISKAITKIIEKPINLKDFTEKLTISTSIGIAKNALSFKNLEDILEFADKNMYANKKNS